jgi:chromosome segregation ATPase
MSGQAARKPGDVLRELRHRDSQVKRAKVLAAVDAMKGRGEPITFRAVARAAGVSHTLVYSEGLREYVESAMQGQARTERRRKQAGAGASAASVATDLELLRAENKALREERDRLKTAVQRGLGAQLENSGTKELTERVRELHTALERMANERDQARAERDRLRAELAETQDQLTSVREANRRIMKSANTGRTP